MDTSGKWCKLAEYQPFSGGQWFSKWDLGASSMTSFAKLLKIEFLRPHPSHIASETSRVGPRTGVGLGSAKTLPLLCYTVNTNRREM